MAVTYLFVDSRVEDIDLLLGGLAPDTRVVLLDPLRDGVDQIAEALAGETDVASIQIVSHGSSATLLIGDTTLTAENIDGYAAQWAAIGEALAAIGEALAADGDLLLWGCAVGEGSAGEAFVQTLSALTGADVAASTDATGSAVLGGDWVLEYSAGAIESTAFAAPEVQAQYA
jgi:hypothetical protein